MLPSVSVEAIDDDGIAVVIKIATDAVEVNVWVPEADLAKLAQVRGRSWESGALRIGSSAGSPAWWSVEAEESGMLSIVIGDDDETWDVAVLFPLETIDEVIREVEACR